jgi:hypothetical protein
MCSCTRESLRELPKLKMGAVERVVLDERVDFSGGIGADKVKKDGLLTFDQNCVGYQPTALARQ